MRGLETVSRKLTFQKSFLLYLCKVISSFQHITTKKVGGKKNETKLSANRNTFFTTSEFLNVTCKC